MTLELLAKTQAANGEWDAFVKTSPAGSVFATTAYLEALSAKYDLWVLRHEGRIEAGLPLVRGVMGLCTNPLYCKYLGFLPSPAASEKSSTNASAMYAQVAGFSGPIGKHASFDYYFHPAIDNWMPFLWLGCRQQTYYTYIIPHSKAETWWDGADSRLRRSVRRGRKSGLRIREARDAQAIESCYRLSMMPYTSRGSRPLISRERFAKLATAVMGSGNGRIWLAESQEGTPISAAFVLEDWKSVYFVFNGTDPKAETGTNSALIAHIVEDAHARGRDFDFEGSVIQPIEGYYRLFGPDLRPYFRIWRPSLVNTGKHKAIALAKIMGGYAR